MSEVLVLGNEKQITDLSEIDVNELLKKFDEEYGNLIDKGERGIYVAGFNEAVDAGDAFLRAHGDFVGQLARIRQEYFSTNNEVAGLAFALDDVGWAFEEYDG